MKRVSYKNLNYIFAGRKSDRKELCKCTHCQSEDLNHVYQYCAESTSDYGKYKVICDWCHYGSGLGGDRAEAIRHWRRENRKIEVIGEF